MLLLVALAPMALAPSAGCQSMAWPGASQGDGIAGEDAEIAAPDAARSTAPSTGDTAAARSDAEQQLASDGFSSRSPEVRLETVERWLENPRSGTLPDELLELRSDRDPRVRAAALSALARGGHEQAAEHLRAALRDHELQVRLAAAAALGELGGSEAEAALAEVLDTGAEQVRAAAVAALAHAGAEQAVLDAAEDESWRVRREVARALAAFPDRTARRTAEALLDDPSAEVHWAVVGAVADWPLELAGPVLLRAMAGEGYRRRSEAAELLAGRWPPAAEFPVDGPASQRNEVRARLEEAFRRAFQRVDPGTLIQTAGVAARPPVKPEQLNRVEALLDRRDTAALAATGPELLSALEALVFDRKHLLPEWVYGEVLARRDSAFEALEGLGSEGLPERRRAAGKLVELARQRPLSRLAVARLHTLILAEPDQLVWQAALAAVAADPGEQAAALACAAIGHPSPEVRRRACEHLGAHPAPGHAKVLLASLVEQSPSVLAAVVRALGSLDRLDDTRPLHPLLMSTHETVALEAARSLHRLGDPSGTEALRRFAQSDDPAVRREVARAIGERPEPTLFPVLVGMLDDHVSVRRAAVQSLEAIAGEESPPAPDGPAPGSSEQVERWKRWAQKQGIATEPRRR
jgi:HEAT repeat protein